MGNAKLGRFILAFLVVFAPLASVRAQVERPAPSPTPASAESTTVPVLRTAPNETATDAEVEPEEVLPQVPERPALSHRGVLVETLDGETVMEEAADQPFNPASAVKVATALAAIRTFGPRHRFATAVWITGSFDKATGTVTGNLVISGRDPSMHDEHAVSIARELNTLGIRTVTGDLIVAPRFTMNFSASSLRSGERLYDTLDSTRRPAAATRAWYESRIALGDQKGLQTTPSVAVMGAVYTDAVPVGARVVMTHYSSKLTDILKVLLCYSNNFMAERLGDTMGGPQGLKRFLSTEIGIPAEELRIASTSGLGVNRVSPRNMLKIYRALVAELEENNLKPSDILPVAGIDPGTLQRRYALSAGRGSIIGKTGTLGRTDGGASALIGQMQTKSGEVLLFVIFNQRGSVRRFRQAQDVLLSDLQQQRGGPLPFNYTPHTLAMTLVNTEVDSTRSASLDEYEPTSN